MIDVPLVSVSSEANRELEEEIVRNTLISAHITARGFSIKEIFAVGLEGIDDHPERFSDKVRGIIMDNIQILAPQYGLEVFHRYDWAFEFKLVKRVRL